MSTEYWEARREDTLAEEPEELDEAERTLISRDVVRQLVMRIQEKYSQLQDIHYSRQPVPKSEKMENVIIDVKQLEYAVVKLTTISKEIDETRQVINIVTTVPPELSGKLRTKLDQLKDEIERALEAKDWIWSMRPDDKIDTVFTSLLQIFMELKELLRKLNQTKQKNWCCGSNNTYEMYLRKVQVLTDQLYYTAELYCTFFDLKPLDVFNRGPIVTESNIRLPTLPEAYINQLVQDFGDLLHRKIPVREKIRVQYQVEKPIVPVVEPIKIETMSIQAEYYLKGLNYFYGYGLPKDFDKAKLHLEKAMKNGNGEAAVFLGKMYIDGNGVEQSDIEALRCFHVATESGNLMGMTMEGSMYEQNRVTNKNTEQNLLKAQNLYTAATKDEKNQDPDALCGLGRLNEKSGRTEEAIGYYTKAIQGGSVEAANNLGQLYAQERVPNTDAVESRRQAIKLIGKAARAGNTQALTNMGLLMMSGAAGEKSYQEAKVWLKKAVNKGDPEAMYYLGYILYQDAVYSEDKELYYKANSLFRHTLSLRPTHPEANYYLGNMLENGHGGSQDLVLAARHYLLAIEADPGQHKAMYRLGKIYLEGRGVERIDKQKAMNYLSKSAAMGNTEAMVFLGDLYTNTGVLKSDPKLAMDYYQRANLAGNSHAQLKVSQLLKRHADTFPAEEDSEFYRWKARGAGFLEAQPILDTHY